ncbi:glycosyltransferase family 4 protein [Roseivirga sp. E12]|uniref:glycosyltransferase family 4 protein n=1 Tax=Roseivirga sp. E12 TaxID=2819237 RepID=UPI001ABC3276|nr:glycosyltransferase family 4 protein [Roseivirga sp. E12]MBO3699078.1 glycosyltransferase family 4 protein [Roseivirga sp. E12]
MKSTNKTIGLVIPAPIGYSETFFTSKVKGLEEAGFKVIIFCARNNDADASFKYRYQWVLSAKPVIRVLQVFFGLPMLLKCPSRGSRYIRYARQSGQSIGSIIRGLYNNGNILTGPRLDTLHFGFTTMGHGREVIGKAMNCKLSTSFRGYDIGVYPLKHGLGCYHKLWKHLDKVHTISDDLLEIAYERLALPTNIRVKKITPAIDTKKFVGREKRQFIRTDKLKILSIGRLHWKKGHEYALKALKELKEAGINFQYDIVGSGKDLERIIFTKTKLGLESEVNVCEEVSHSDVPELMKSHDILLHPSVQEGFGNTVLEAQAAGMLCIVSDAEGLAENVLHEKTGWVVPKRNSAMIARQLLEILNMPQDELLQISKMAQNRVLNQYDLEAQKSAFTQFFNA